MAYFRQLDYNRVNSIVIKGVRKQLLWAQNGFGDFRPFNHAYFNLFDE